MCTVRASCALFIPCQIIGEGECGNEYDNASEEESQCLSSGIPFDALLNLRPTKRGYVSFLPEPLLDLLEITYADCEAVVQILNLLVERVLLLLRFVLAIVHIDLDVMLHPRHIFS